MTEFYSNERVVGHHVSAEYEISDTFLGGKNHRVQITEGDVGWEESREVMLTPEEIIALYDALIENHLDDLEQLAENSGYTQGYESSELVQDVLSEDNHEMTDKVLTGERFD